MSNIGHIKCVDFRFWFGNLGFSLWQSRAWGRNWQPTPVFLPGESHGRGAWWAAVHGIAPSQTQVKRLSMYTCIGEGNGNPLQYSCLENPRDGRAWWAAIYGVAQSRTRLKRLSSSSQEPLRLILEQRSALMKCIFGRLIR